jgi:hypothetical protein
MRPLHGVLSIREAFSRPTLLVINNPYPMIKKQVPGSFVSVDVSRRTRKSQFFHQINAVLDWTVFDKELYKFCKRSIQDAAGEPTYNPLVLFKMMLLQT